MKSTLSFAALWLLLTVSVLHAHNCPDSVITIPFGGVATVRITADVAESEASHYNLSINSNPAVASVAPDNVNSFAYGEFRLKGVSPGTNDIVLEWDYAPHNASGFCVVRVIVEPPATDPRDVADDTTAANAESAGMASDPVNTYTGEYVLEEPADLDLGGPMPVRFTRYYASGLNRENLVHSNSGLNWMHNYEMHLVDFGTNVVVVFSGGKRIPFDAAGTEWKLAGSQRIPYALKTAAGERLLLDPEQNWVYHFNGDGNLAQIEDTRGNSIALTYQAGQLIKVSDGIGRTLAFTYSGFQQISSVSDGTRTVRFTYSGNNLSRVTDAAGGITQYQYDNFKARGGLMTAKLLPEGNSLTTQTYDSKGRVIEQTRADGGKFTFGYNGLETSITNPAGKVQKQLHDANGNLIQFTEEKGGKIITEFDSLGRRISETTRSGGKYAWSYDNQSGELASAVKATEPSFAFERTGRSFRGFTLYEASKITYSDGATELFQQDANGNIISVIDRAGRQTTSSYNSQGRVLAMTNSAGGIVTCEYNADGTRKALRRRIPGGTDQTITYGYDALRRLNSIQYPDGKMVLYTYNNLDLITSVTDEESALTSYEYSANGLLKKITYPMGNTIRMSYDRMNQLTNVTDHAGRVVTQQFDSMSRLISVTDRNGNKQSFAYDELSQMTNYVDAGGQSWSREYTVDGRIASLTDPLGNTRRYGYSGDRLRSISLPPEEYRFTYDDLARPIAMEFPPGRTNSLFYYPDGTLNSVLLPGNISSHYTLGSLGLVESVEDPNGKSWQTVHDALGRMKAFVDPLQRSTQYTFDSRDRLSTILYPGQLGFITNSYNGRGQIIRRNFSDGTAIEYAYDANGRTTSATGLTLAYSPQDDVTTCNGLAIGRDTGGRMTSLTLATGKVIQYAYDSRNLVTNITDWLGGKTTFEYDAAGRLTGITRPNGVKTVHTYDAANRLAGIMETRSQVVLASTELTRDPAGWITAARKTLPLEPVVASRPLSGTYDAASQLTGADYDALGRMTRDGARQFEWNLDSRLKRFASGATNIVFEYDAFGSLLAQTSNGTRREFVWNYAFPLRSPVVIRDAGADTTYLVHTPRGELLYAIDAATGARRYYHFDETGNTLFLTDDSGAVTDSYAYSPYGALVTRNGSRENPFLFGGRYSILSYPAGELVYMRQRWLDTKNARFLSRDPNWGGSINPNELNPYAFSRSNPLYYTDPLGLDARVNQSGVHTDISVDIWQGDEVVGTLTVSYAAKGYKGKFGGIGEAISTVIGGTPGEFSVDFRPGSVRDTSSPDAVAKGTQIIISGTREQDERLRLALAGIIGADGKWEFVGRGQSIIRQFIYKSRKDKHQHFVMDATIEDWETYRAVSQSCNDFTDAMLDIYFGENWYVGPLFEGDGVTSELKDYLRSKAPPPTFDANGIAPITGGTVVR